MTARRLLILAIGAVVALGGCATPPPAAELPDGVEVSVYQTRLDRGSRKIEIRIANETNSDLHIVDARFASNQLVEPAVWQKDSTVVRAGLTLDLKVPLPAANCDFDGDVTNEVTLRFELEDGSSGSVTLEPDDPLGHAASLTAQDCVAASVAEHATISVSGDLQYAPGTATPAVIELAVEPTGAEGELTIESVSNTVLITVVADPQYTNGLGITIGPNSKPSVIHIGVVPLRCDPHAVAEDKRGTFFPISVIIDGSSQTLYFGVGDSMRAQLNAFIGDYCGSS